MLLFKYRSHRRLRLQIFRAGVKVYLSHTEPVLLCPTLTQRAASGDGRCRDSPPIAAVSQKGRHSQEHRNSRGESWSSSGSRFGPGTRTRRLPDGTMCSRVTGMSQKPACGLCHVHCKRRSSSMVAKQSSRSMPCTVHPFTQFETRIMRHAYSITCPKTRYKGFML